MNITALTLGCDWISTGETMTHRWTSQIFEQSPYWGNPKMAKTKTLWEQQWRSLWENTREDDRGEIWKMREWLSKTSKTSLERENHNQRLRTIISTGFIQLNENRYAKC